MLLVFWFSLCQGYTKRRTQVHDRTVRSEIWYNTEETKKGRLSKKHEWREQITRAWRHGMDEPEWSGRESRTLTRRGANHKHKTQSENQFTESDKDKVQGRETGHWAGHKKTWENWTMTWQSLKGSVESLYSVLIPLIGSRWVWAWLVARQEPKHLCARRLYLTQPSLSLCSHKALLWSSHSCYVKANDSLPDLAPKMCRHHT